MPIKFESHPDGYCILHFSGRLTDQEVLEGCTEFYDEVWRPGLAQLTDVSDADPRDVSNSTLQKIAELARQRTAGHPPAKVSVYASGDLAFGLARVYTVMAREQPGEIRVFRQRQEAVEWLLED